MVILDRYRGFEDVAHGGYVAGLLAQSLGESAEVTLRRPPPLNRSLAIEPDADGGIVLRDGDSIVAEASAASFATDVPRTVSYEEAEEASRAYPGHATHPFPSCFACGPLRDPGDGLRLFAGPVDGSPIVAAPFVPPAALADESGMLGSELAWAAVDCPQLWALMQSAPSDSRERVVTSQLTATVRGRLAADARYVVMAWPAGRDGDRLYGDAAILTEEGEPIAVARQTSVVVEGWGVPLGADVWRSMPVARST